MPALMLIATPKWLYDLIFAGVRARKVINFLTKPVIAGVLFNCVIMTTETHSTTEHGMSNAGYVRIAGILAAITALEVATYYIDLGALFLPSLLIMMAVKFYIVVSFFMHLRYESKMFSWVFYAGLFLAMTVYGIFLATFHFFS